MPGGYSYGATGEWTQDWWTLRAGLFDLSRVPNSTELETDFSQFEVVLEGEARHTWLGQPGKIKLLGFVNRGRNGFVSRRGRAGRGHENDARYGAGAPLCVAAWRFE